MGNFKDVAVIDVLVKPGDRIEPESPLVTLETEKATMDVPSTVGGIIERVAVNKGGKVNAGDVVVAVRLQDGAAQGAGADARPAEGGAKDDSSARTGAPAAPTEGATAAAVEPPREAPPARAAAPAPAAERAEPVPVQSRAPE